MSTNWTHEQLSAVYARDCNLLVSAAAGAGKTAVLVERIIQKILDQNNPTDIDRLLVVTFTKAAAAEMRERISSAIGRELNNNPASRHLNRQLALLNRASITTLHSFCLEVLRQYFYRIDLDPAFRVADDTEVGLMRLEALDEVFEACYEAGDSDFLTLVDSYGGDRNDVFLQEMVLKLYEFAASNPWPAQWLAGLAGSYRDAGGGPLGDNPWGKSLLDWVELQLQGCLTKLETAVRNAGSPGGPAVYMENLRDDSILVNDLLNAVHHSWENAYLSFSGCEFAKLKRCADKTVDDNLKSTVQKGRDEVKKTVIGLKTSFFSREPRELASDLHQVAPLIETLTRLVAGFTEKYRLAKQAKGLVDFADLEHYCLQILLDITSSPGIPVPSAAALEIRERFDEILVDEYQDINAVQEAILNLVSREAPDMPNRFMVGDVKQSIYRFRLADPTLFMEKYRDYPRQQAGHNLGIDLTMNFRSRPEVIDAVNYVFRQLMTARVGEISYDNKAELVSGASYAVPQELIKTAAGPVEVYLLEKRQTGEVSEDTEDKTPDDGDAINSSDNFENNHDDSQEPDAVQKEARLVAARISKMVSGTGENKQPEFFVHDKNNGYRPVQYRDIVILLRATRNTANTFIEEFRQAGIPAYADLSSGYFEATEVETVLALLKVIDNPRQDIPLAALLRSPIVGLNAADLAAVRLQDRTGDFYEAVKLSALAGETPADLKLSMLLDTLEKWRTMARQGSLAELIWQLYNETGYYAYVGGMPGGSQRQANLRALYDRARQYEATNFRGLFRFLRFIEKFQETGFDLGAARAIGENEDVVRIISIHKSKGLEFPVVFVAGMGKQFNTMDLKQRAVLHKELGLGLPVVDLNLRLTYPTIAYSAIGKKMHMELLAEEMRILYVALTRAREKLVLIGSLRDLAKSAGRWCENVSCPAWELPDTVLAGAKTYLDWLGPAIARHPGGQELRNLAGCDTVPDAITQSNPSSWLVSIVPDLEQGIPAPEAKENQSHLLEYVSRGEAVPADDNYLELLDRRLNWHYSWDSIVGKPAKATVTELKRRFAAQEPGESETTAVTGYRSLKSVRPNFLRQDTGLSAAERGSVMHLFMQHLDFRQDLTLEILKHYVTQMVQNELLTLEQADSVDLGAVMSFLASPLGRRVTKSVKVRKELPFTIALPAGQVFAEVPGDFTERVIVQGVIDCLVDEGDGFILIDYKTDAVNEENILQAAARYSGQLNLYTTAVETILQKPVREKYLYFFSLGREIRCS